MRLGVAAALIDGRRLSGDVEIQDGRIARAGLPPARSGLAVPGFVDLHVNGFAGVDFMTADPVAYTRARDAMLATGTTAFQPTFISAPEATLRGALEALPGDVIGAHLEGPFLSPRRLGAHDPAHRADPDTARLIRSLHRVTMVTLAPELPGADALVDALTARGIAVSAGHSDATAREAHAAFDKSVRTVTHLFNAMRPSTTRAPSLAFAALARDDVIVQVIADLHHVAPDTLRVAAKAAAGRLALVTDATAAAAMPDGEYTLAGRPIVSRDGVVRDPHGGLAGTALTMLDAVRNLHGLGVPLDEALRAASETPARVIRRADLGRLVPGGRADLVVLDDRLEVRRVLVNGGERVGR
jgi:N-acetylglucosamine-6-phosphate deacetylase